MKTAVINLKVDPTLKKKAQIRAKKLGVPLSYVMRTYLLNFAQGDNAMMLNEPMTPHLEKLIRQVEVEVARGDVSPAFDSNDFEGMKRWLEADTAGDS